MAHVLQLLNTLLLIFVIVLLLRRPATQAEIDEQVDKMRKSNDALKGTVDQQGEN